MSRSLLAALVAAFLAIVPAAARAQDGPTLTFDKRCYAAGDPMAFTGSGFTPGGAVTLFRVADLVAHGCVRHRRRRRRRDHRAGRRAGPGMFLDDDARSARVGGTATDKTRLDPGAPPESAVGGTVLTLRTSRSAPPNGPPPRARKPMRVAAYGFTRAIGRTLYVQYRKHAKVLKAVKLGRLGGECGDRNKTLRRGLPRGLRPGRYTLMFTTSLACRGDGERVSFTQRFR